MMSPEYFSLRLREVRKGLTQAQAAESIGISQQGWARYESGKVLPGAEVIHQICSSFDVSADWLLGLSNVRERDSVVAPKRNMIEMSFSGGKNATSKNHTVRQYGEVDVSERIVDILTKIESNLKMINSRIQSLELSQAASCC